MYVLEVLPLSKSAALGTLSYRAQDKAEPGTLLRIPLRNQETLGVVLSSTPVQDAKASLKRATFALRGASLSGAGRIPDAYMHAAHEIALAHATGEGSVLLSLAREYLSQNVPAFTKGAGAGDTRIEDVYKKRVRAYERAIEAAAKRGASSLVLAPTRVEAKRLAKAYKTRDPVVLTGEEPAKRREKLIEKALSSSLVIATPGFAWLPMPSLGLIVVERLGAGTYVRERHPYLDMRHAAHAYAKARDIDFLAGDFPLPLSSRKEPSHALGVTLPGSATVIDARPVEDDQKGTRVPFRALPLSVMPRLHTALSRGGRVAILATRRGFSPSVVCRDCGTSVKDAEGRTLSFLKQNGVPMFRSSDGKTIRGADIHCVVCGGWNLLPLGVGVERVAEEAAAAFPEASLVVFDSAALRKKGALDRLMKKAAEPGTILVGTEAMLAHLDPLEAVEEGIIASADSLLSLPFWNARERLVRLGLAFRERARHLTILTRNPDDTAFSAITTAHDETFWTEEALLRKRFSYPPCGRLIVLRTEGTMRALDAITPSIEKAVGKGALIRMPDRVVSLTRRTRSFVMKVNAREWPDEALSARIAALPPSVRVYVDPDSLW